MRIRNVLPEFFKDDRLAQTPPLARILFLGLHGLADRRGRLEDRPIRIKAEVLPYDEVNTAELLNALAEVGCIVRYATAAGRFIVIPSFEAEQHINSYEKKTESRLPPPPIEAPSEQFQIHFGSASDAHPTNSTQHTEALPRAEKPTSDVRPRIGEKEKGEGRRNLERSPEALRKERPASPTASESVSDSPSDQGTPAAGSAGADDAVANALAVATLGRGLAGMTRRERRQVGLALAEIRAASPGAGWSEFEARVRRYRSIYREAACTPMALARHWGACGPADGAASVPPVEPAEPVDIATEPDGWRDIVSNALLGHIPDAAEWADIGPALRTRIVREYRERQAARAQFAEEVAHA